MIHPDGRPRDMPTAVLGSVSFGLMAPGLVALVGVGLILAFWILLSALSYGVGDAAEEYSFVEYVLRGVFSTFGLLAGSAVTVCLVIGAILGAFGWRLSVRELRRRGEGRPGEFTVWGAFVGVLLLSPVMIIVFAVSHAIDPVDLLGYDLDTIVRLTLLFLAAAVIGAGAGAVAWPLVARVARRSSRGTEGSGRLSRL